MDVFFCDLCGARVTDGDLRSGQGQRSRWDVICANCLEQGLGKEWLGKRSSGRKAAVGAADPADRVATIDAEPPAAPVVAAPAAAAPEPDPEPEVDLVAALPPPPLGLAVSPSDDDEAEPALDDHVATTEGPAPLHATAKVEAPVHDAGSSMAAAASAFSALGANSSRPLAAQGEDDDLVDGAYATPAEQLTPAGVPALGESPFGAQARLDNPEKDETAMVPALPGTEEADLELGETPKKPGSSTSARRKSARGGTSSRITKPPTKGKSSRKAAARGGKDHSSTILMVGVGLLVVIGVLFGVVMVGKKSGGGSAAAPEVATEQIRSAIKSAEQQAITALRGDDLNAMIAARAAMKAAQEKIYAFEDDMLKQGNTQDRIDGYLDSLKTSDAMMLLRNLNDEIIKRQNQNR